MSLDIAVVGAIETLTSEQRALLFDRGRATDPDVERVVRGIIDDVRTEGDAALRAQALRFDRAELTTVEVPRSSWQSALAQLDPAVRAGLEQAAAAIADFHRAQLPALLEVETRPGVKLGRRADPLDSVGVYAPGGRAAYPSSVLMGVVPARVAGVREVVVCSPAGPDGAPPAAVLAAAAIGGADRVFAIGGAGAIAALALGTESVPRVAKIVGPGNAYVTEAKRQLTGLVAIDCPAGPSEILVIADESADADIVAAEMLAQAEHDPDAAAVLVTTDATLSERVLRALQRLVQEQPRAQIILASLAARGGLLVATSTDDALAFSEQYAPEHLLVLTREPRALLPRLRGAGTIFLGAYSSVAFGDYITGANHVLPTAGLARAYAGLSTMDFVRWTTYQEVAADAARLLSAPTATLADAEGLPGHAFAARLRGEGVTGREDGAARPVQLRPEYAGIELYDPQRTPVEIDLSDNTSLFGVSAAARRALADMPAHAVTRYPSVFADELKRELAKLHGVAVENVTTGCGSDDVIDSALRAFCAPGDVLAYAAPTFSMLPLFAEMNALTPRAVPLGDDFVLDPVALQAARARVAYVCNPNNPTGTVTRPEVLRSLDEGDPIVFLDEAYADFSTEDLTAWAAGSSRVISLRTLSKAHGLAGLRIGYAVGPAGLIREIEKSRGPYKVSAAAEAAALAVLRSDAEYARRNVAEVQRNRERFAAELKARGLRVWPSQANFVLVQVPRSTARDFGAAMKKRGVSVRAFPAVPQAGECVRISIGPWAMMERCLQVLDEVSTEG